MAMTTKFGQVIIGPPASGKTTYVNGLSQFLPAIERPITIINLDPACDQLPYNPHIDIRELITVNDVMEDYNLGPNGSMLYCFEYIDLNFDWLEYKINELNAEYLVIDLPGQVELTTGHNSLINILNKLNKNLNCRFTVVHLTDSQSVADPSRYIAVVLLSLRTMLALEQPQINVFSKIDLLPAFGDLPFNLEYYTEVQDLDYICDHLNTQRHTSRLEGLNRAICEMIEDFGLVSFETLAVEDKLSMMKLVRLTDRACGYIFQSGSIENDSALSLFSSAIGSLPTELQTDVQERWLDAREDYDEFENELWKQEGEMEQERSSKRSLQESKNNNGIQSQTQIPRPTVNTYSADQKPKIETTKKP